MLSRDFTHLKIEPNICTQHQGSHFLIVSLYVDDIRILASTPEIIVQAKKELQSTFSITDLGPLTYFLGSQVAHDRQLGTCVIHQTKFVDEILSQFGMITCKLATAPMLVTYNRTARDSSVFS